MPKKAATVEGNKTFSTTVKKLKPRKAYKAYVRAWVKKDGKKAYVKKSPVVCAYTAVKAKVKHSKASIVTLGNSKAGVKVGKTFRIRAPLGISANNHLLPTTHASILRYYSSNKKIATVSKSGKVKIVSKGTRKTYTIAATGTGR